jgi:hypothetical protein
MNNGTKTLIKENINFERGICQLNDNEYMVIVNDDLTLYHCILENGTYKSTPIMTHVNKVTEHLIYRNNFNEVYLYRNSRHYFLDIPERITSNCYEIVEEDPGYWYIYRTRDNKYYIYRYSESGSEQTESNHARFYGNFCKEVNNFSRYVTGTKDFYYGLDGKVYLANKKYSNIPFLDESIYKFIESNNTYKEGVFFITTDGELYAANKGGVGTVNEFREYSAPFLTIFNQKQTKIYLNHNEIKLTTKLQERNNRTMYPFRECLEQLGATVLWDSLNQIAIGEYGNITIEFPIGTNKYYINGAEYEMDTISYIDNSIGRTYIPIRYAAESLGFTVEWKEGETENTISIYR